MKTKIFFLYLFLSFVAISYAQQLSVNRKAGVRASYNANKFWDNWFAQAGIGGQFLFAEDVMNVPFSTSEITFIPTFALGKWIRPWIGLRAKVEGGALHSFHDEDHTSMQKDFYYDGHLDLMVSVTNFFWKYDPKRKYDFVAYGGAGYYSRKESTQLIPAYGINTYNDAKSNLSFHAGLSFEYRLNKNMGFYVDIAGLLADDYFNRIKQARRFDGVLSTTVGITFYFGNTYFYPGNQCSML